MTRRPQGGGSVYPTRGGTRWIAQLDLGRDATGRRKRIARTATTKKQAQVILNELRAAHAADASSEAAGVASETTADYLEQWFATERSGWSDRTIELYRHQLDTHMLPVIGTVPLGELRPRHVQEMLDAIAAKGSRPTANKCRALLYSALRKAVKLEKLDRNPAEAVDPLKEPRVERTVWTQEQAASFMVHHVGHRLYAAFYLLLTAGLRRGELLGLRWEDLASDGLHVRQTITTVGNRPRIGAPKSRTSRRFVHLPPDAIEVLAQHKRQQDAQRQIVGRAWAHPE